MTVKLRKLSIRGFRGARFRVPIDFTADYKSVAVFGENAGGKSTITDSIEWFITGRVGHLWKDECKESALRNVLLDPTETTEVLVEFDSGTKKATRSLSATSKTTIDNKAANFQALLKSLGPERFILRHAQVTKFVAKTKSEKKAELAEIIGYEAITNFRDVVQSSLNALRKDASYVGARHMADSAQAQLFKLSGEIIATTGAFHSALNKIIAPLCVGVEIKDNETIVSVQKKLQERIANPDRAKQILELEKVKSDSQTLRDRAAEVTTAFESSFSSYNKLVESQAAVEQLKIEQFLAKGRDVLDAGLSEQKCPFCLTDYDLSALHKEVEARIAAIAEMRAQYDGAATNKAKFSTAVRSFTQQCTQLCTDAEKSGLKKLGAAARDLAAALTSWTSELDAAFTNFDGISVPTEVSSRLGTFVNEAKLASDTVAGKLKALSVSAQEQSIIDAIEKMNELRSSFSQYKKNAGIVQTYEGQINALDTVLSTFIPIQNRALQEVLDNISEDVRSYYSQLHPDEEVDQVRLVVVGEEGVEFEYKFHGTPTYPPLKYLSESHLNSLGICLFLASAKLFNKVGRFLVLDDVLTSFDAGHRRRLLRLLRNQFADWQVILLTHERVWFDIMKKELKSAGWLFNEVECDHVNGISLAASATDLKALIAEKRKKYDVSNDLRKLCEATLKDICSALEVRVAFRFNDDNEARMTGELLSDLIGSVNRKCSPLKGNAAFANLEGSNLIINVGSHDNPAKEIVGGDIDVALADIAALEALFRCGDCGRYVDANNPVAGTNKISCKCGKKDLEWK